jgi:hypothetical protein
VKQSASYAGGPTSGPEKGPLQMLSELTQTARRRVRWVGQSDTLGSLDTEVLVSVTRGSAALCT